MELKSPMLYVPSIELGIRQNPPELPDGIVPHRRRPRSLRRQDRRRARSASTTGPMYYAESWYSCEAVTHHRRGPGRFTPGFEGCWTFGVPLLDAQRREVCMLPLDIVPGGAYRPVTREEALLQDRGALHVHISVASSLPGYTCVDDQCRSRASDMRYIGHSIYVCTAGSSLSTTI